MLNERDCTKTAVFSILELFVHLVLSVKVSEASSENSLRKQTDPARWKDCIKEA